MKKINLKELAKKLSDNLDPELMKTITEREEYIYYVLTEILKDNQK
jgi:hypothetical protein